MTVRIHQGDCRDVLPTLPDGSVHCCVTSPPYWSLRDYQVLPSIWGGHPECGHEWGEGIRKSGGAGKQGATSQRVGRANVAEQEIHRDQGNVCQRCGAWRGCLGLEPDIGMYVEHIVEIFREVRRVLRDDGTLWLNLASRYASDSTWGGATGGKHAAGLHGETGIGRNRRRTGYKDKDLIPIPWLVGIGLQQDGWWLRSSITWAKKAPMPESCKDRPTCATEYVLLLAKNKTYFYDATAVAEPAQEWAGQAGTFSRANGKATELLIPGQSRVSHRADRADRVLPGTRTMRNLWLLGPEPFPASHFATFVTEIPRRAILAGTSEKGACPACGAPWVRALETGSTTRQTFAGSNGQQEHPPGANHTLVPIERRTVGWQPSCSCTAGDPVPCVCLDPFAGAGTTGLVADRLGRDAILVELNPAYCELGRKRITADAPLLADVR